jgi:hypothetical protein
MNIDLIGDWLMFDPVTNYARRRQFKRKHVKKKIKTVFSLKPHELTIDKLTFEVKAIKQYTVRNAMRAIKK